MKYNEYRVIEGYGSYFNKRWEVQEKYSYYNNINGKVKKIESWHTIFHSADKDKCIEVMKKYKTIPKKDYRIPFDVTLWQ